MNKNTKAPQVIGIASGKGGVGKTSVTSNLAVALTQRNHRVMVFDADLGLANAQIALGVHAPFNIGHVLRFVAGLAALGMDATRPLQTSTNPATS